MPRLKGAHWVEPKLVIRVEFADWTADDLLRQAAFKGLEIGKAPTSVRREREVDAATATAAAEREVHNAPMQTDDAAAALEAMEREGIWQVAGREVRVTNLDKVLFPGRDGGAAVTKRDLFRYHLAIGPTLVPYLRDRGLTVQRFPNGDRGRRGSGRRTCRSTRRRGSSAGPTTTARRGRRTTRWSTSRRP